MQYTMATEVNQNCFGWPMEEPSVQDSSQGTPVLHGSISFGRFDLESLAWEKWSVFTNDRRNEEFLKFNGLVAKKKAYFEEYFKRVRELKALQQQNQQTELNLEYSGDGSDSSQTGEDQPVEEHGSPAGSAPIDDSMEQTAAELECYKDQNECLSNEISASTHSSPVGGLQPIGHEARMRASGDSYADRIDMSQQHADYGQHDVEMPHGTLMTPKRTTQKCSQISQASKILPRTVKNTSTNIPDNTVVNKGPYSGRPTVLNQKSKPGSIQPLQKLKAASSNVLGTTGRSKLVTKEAAGVVAVRRPSSAASQRPSTRERRPVTRDGSQKPAKMASPCRPSTAERRPAIRELAPKQANTATPRRPSTADKRPIIKEMAPKHVKISAPLRPSTPEQRPITRETAQKHAISIPLRPSTAERRPITREMASKHVIANQCWPSTAERRPVSRGTAQKHADVVTLRRPSTAERRPITRETAPKPADVISPHRPSTADRRPVARENLFKHGSVASPCQPSTPDRRLSRESAPKHADVAITPRRPSTGERRPIAKESSLISDQKTPIRPRAMPAHPKGAATAGTPKKASTPNLVKSSKPEIKSYLKERMELRVDGKQKSSSLNLPPRKMLNSNVRDNQAPENIKKPNKEGILETLRSRVSASRNAIPLQTGSVKTRAPNPPPPPPPPRQPSQMRSKPNPNNLSAGGRKPKASVPHWH